MPSNFALHLAHIGFAMGLVALVILGVRLRRRVPVGVLLAALGALLLRLFWVTPAFVHDSFHGPLILNGVLAFPGVPGNGSYGAGYGPGSFVVLGLISMVTGRSAEGVMAANALVSALATIPLAAAAARLSGRPRAGLYAALLWAASPLVARLAHSEDAHIVGIAFALMGLAWAEVATSERSVPALWAAVLATALAVWSRQTLIPFAPLVAGMIVERRSGLDRRQVALACAALGLFLGVRLLATTGSSDGVELMVGLSLVVRHPEWLIGFLSSHPLFAVPRLPVVVPLLFAVGAIDLFRRSAPRLSLSVIWIGLFLLSLPAGSAGVGPEWSFRFPIYALSIMIAGAGAAWIESRVPRVAVVVLTLLLGGAGWATLENRASNAEFVEYVYLRDALSRLRGVTLIGYEQEGSAWRLPAVLADRIGVRVVLPKALPRTPAPGKTYVMLDGIGCYARDLGELLGVEAAGAHQLPDRATVERLLTIALDPGPGQHGLTSVRRPEGPRAACARIFEQAVPFGPPGPTVTLVDGPPTAIFSQAQLQLRLVEWRGQRAETR